MAKAFWTCNNMRTAAYLAMKRRGLKPTLELKKALRYHYQRLADMGKFKAPTSAELATVGIDTSTWDDYEGYLPVEMKSARARLEIEKLKKTGLRIPDSKNRDLQPGEMQVIVEPNFDDKTRVKNEQIKQIVRAGPRFGKIKVKDEKPPWTGRKWKGEHYNRHTKVWELKDGCWWNPEYKKRYTPTGRMYYEGGWQRGKPRLTPYYWSYEFMFDPHKYEDPVPYSHFMRDVFDDIESNKRSIIKLPRDHLKTTMYHVNYSCYYILERPELSRHGILSISWDPSLAEVTFLDVTENLSMNERILSFYGYVIDENRPKTADKIYFVYQGIGAKFGLRCTSFKSGSITGSHPYLVLMDDIQDEPLGDKLMKKFRRIMLIKLIPAVGKRGKIVITGTTKGWDEDNDGYIWLGNNPSWTVIEYYATVDGNMPPMKDVIVEEKRRIIYNEDGDPIIKHDGTHKTEKYFHVTVKDREKYKPLYPERYTIEDLVVKRLEMQQKGKSDDEFWREYFQRAVNPAGKFFRKNRIQKMPPPGYFDTQSFLDWIHKFNYPVYLWIDPGGKKGHGIAIVVATKIEGKYYILDIIVARAGLPEVAKIVARLIVKYGVTTWGCEGNFDQAEAYANTIKTFMRNFMIEQDWLEHYSTPVIKSNRGNKMQRIQTQISTMIGLDGSDYQFYVNQEAQDYDVFETEITTFGLDSAVTDRNEFDVIDNIASMNIHMFPRSRRAVIIAM